jgi:hypothetical protein
MLASYEGRDSTDTQGQSLYEAIVIADNDLPMIEGYLSQSLLSVRQNIDDMIKDVSQDTTTRTEVWTLRSIQRRYNPKGLTSLQTHIKEAASAMVMTAWLAFHGIADRAEFYTALSDNMMKLIIDNLYTKSAPQRPQQL